MGAIRQLGTGRTFWLGGDDYVGRSPICALHLEASYVSMQHAALRWAGNAWELRDLGSRNGTVLDGVQLRPGQACRVETRSRIAFGSAQEQWEVVDDSPPKPMFIPHDGGEPVAADGKVVVLPSPDDPQATVFRADDGGWYLERGDGIVPLVRSMPTLRYASGARMFEVGGRRWRFCDPIAVDALKDTGNLDPDRSNLPIPARDVSLFFAVSTDGELIEINASIGGTRVSLGARSHYNLFLTLAQRRLFDAKQGLPEEDCGWVSPDTLAAVMTSERLNIDVFRLRKQFATMGVADPASIIERRPTRQLRIGTGRIVIKNSADVDASGVNSRHAPSRT